MSDLLKKKSNSMKKCHRSNKTRQSCLSNDVITHPSLQERGDEVDHTVTSVC